MNTLYSFDGTQCLVIDLELTNTRHVSPVQCSRGGKVADTRNVNKVTHATSSRLWSELSVNNSGL